MTPKISLGDLFLSMTDFLLDHNSGVTFEYGFKSHEGGFTVDLAFSGAGRKVHFLPQKIGPAEHLRYVNLACSDEPSHRTFHRTNKMTKTL